MYALAAAFTLAAVLCYVILWEVDFFRAPRRVSVSESRLSSTTRRRVLISRISHIILSPWI